MTEDEAKKKWCPFVRHKHGSSGNGVNRVHGDRSYDYANCIGSACMAWRWDIDACEVLKVKHGYCGLAGKP